MSNISPGTDTNSPLSMLAAVVSSPSEDTKEKNKTKVERLANLFFSDNKQRFYSHIASEAPKEEICKDLSTSAIYISAGIVVSVGEKFRIPNLVALGKLTLEQIKSNKVKEQLDGIQGLTLFSTYDENDLVLVISSYNNSSSPHKRPEPPTDLKNTKVKHKRLSIDTRIPEKVESNPDLMEQMKSSYIVKQQQQAIIDSRTRSAVASAHPDYSSQSLLRTTTKREPLSGIDQIASPRAEFPNRELPKPRGYDNHSYPHSAHPLSMPSRIPSPPGNPPPPTAKAEFLDFFEQLYDSLEATKVLQAQLKEQIRKSSTLLYTLSSSGQMIEGLVRSHVRDMQNQYGERYASALTDLNQRLMEVEQKTLGRAKNTFIADHQNEPKKDH